MHARMIRSCAAACAGLLLALPAMGGPPEHGPVSITVQPVSCTAPCSVRLEVRILPDDSNRSVTIAADSGEFYRSSTRPLDGSEAPTLHELILNKIPAGTYEVRVVVTRVDDPPRTYVRQFAVAGFAE